MSFTPYNRNALISLLQAALDAVKNQVPVEKICDTCLHCDHGQVPFCKAARAKIPAEVLKIGCNAYVFDPTSPPL